MKVGDVVKLGGHLDNLTVKVVFVGDETDSNYNACGHILVTSNIQSLTVHKFWCVRWAVPLTKSSICFISTLPVNTLCRWIKISEVAFHFGNLEETNQDKDNRGNFIIL